MNRIIDKLKASQNRPSTKQTYLNVWRQFNRFIIRLNYKPVTWEEQAILFTAHLVEQGLQSSTIKSYISATKRILLDDGYQSEDQKMLLSAITKACKLKNDRVQVRLPIGFSLLELILFEIKRHFMAKSINEPYLTILYQALFAIGYYGM